jgi:hypothetical protein
MENFNKNNPFIIIAKKIYDNIVDELHIFSKDCIKAFIRNGILSVIAIILLVYTAIFDKVYFLYGIIVLIGILNLLSYNRFIKTMKYYMSDHQGLQEFSRLSELEVNDILALNNEALLKCIHDLHFLRGEIAAVKKYYFFSGSTHYTAIVSITAIISIILTKFVLLNI